MMVSKMVDRNNNPSPRTPKPLQAKLLDRWNSPSPGSAGSTSRKKIVSPFWNCTYTIGGSDSSFAKNDPTERLVNTTTIKKQNEKSIRNYKEKNIRERKVPERVPSRGMSLTTKPPVLQNIVAAEESKEETSSEFALSLQKTGDKGTSFIGMDASDLRMIRRALKKNAFFNRMNSRDLGELVQSFEHIEVAKGVKVVTQGHTGDYFYIVGHDSIVSFEANGVKLGEAEDGGSFGELSLIYSCPRAATVVAMSSPTDLFRVNRKSFKMLLKKQIKSSSAQKIKLLEEVDFLSGMSEFDRITLSRAMTPVVFQPDTVLVKKGEEASAFYIIHEGELKVTDVSVGGTKFDDMTIGPGDYFGERSLATKEPTAANVVAVTKGFAFRIDRKTFEGVLGDFHRVIMKTQDRAILEGMEMFQSLLLTEQQFEELANLVADKKFVRNEKIFSSGRSTNAALYLVRNGSITLTGGRSDVINPGAYFGEDLLLLDAQQDEDSVKGAPTLTSPSYTAVANEDCECGVLTLSDCRIIFETTKMLGLESGLEVLSEEASEFSDEDLSLDGVPTDDLRKREQRNSARSSYHIARASSIKPSRKPSKKTSAQWLQKSSKNGLRLAVQDNLKLEDLKKHEVLGTGQFGEVFLVSAFVSSEYGKHLFALKTQKKNDDLRGDSVNAIKREIEVLKKMDHPYIVNLVHYYENPEEMQILMGAVYGGELFDVIHTENSDGTWSSGLPESDAKFYAMVITDTLDYIHRKQYIYRDLKPENVLIDEDGYPIICDFGFAKLVTDKTYTLCGTPNYLSPEIIMNIGHDASTDHWALGILIYEMVAGENPFYYDGITQMDLLKSICGEKMYPLPDSASDDVFEVVDGLLQKDPNLRLGSKSIRGKEIMAKEWFRGLDLDDLRQKKHVAPYIPDNKTMDRLKITALSDSLQAASLVSNADNKRRSGRRESGFRSSMYSSTSSFAP